ncbi:unnamed protein product [Acanthoscelides obtectus]|uniref:Myosin motor domain-containing protein n=1 Tax=Acanthoscelides obtectus TaxID=200917 RepID=A0A9P0NYC9_ACAOB|nr:unnamed protein product [Acanthoscelides obtectus]CAK1652985.1 Myosin IB heavy chain [Acanthoscelides obtectus]
MATLGLSKVFILDKYFTELQKFWETEKKLQAVHLQQRLRSLSTELVTLRNRLHVQGNATPASPGSAPTAPSNAAAGGTTSAAAAPPTAVNVGGTAASKAPPPPTTAQPTAAQLQPAVPPRGAVTVPPLAVAPLNQPRGPPQISPVNADLDDLIHLQAPLTEDAVMKCLYARFQAGNFYTNVGPILLCVNPYRDVGNPLTLSSTRGLALSPQLNKVVQEAVRQHHASMLLLRQLFAVAGGGPETDAFKHLAAAFTVLRSLGSAKTTTNSESSRIGQFIEVQVTDGALYRTKIHCYFLDQTRVIKPLPGEKNYHIFYQMLAGLSNEERAKLNLEGHKPSTLRYLQYGDTRQNVVEDSNSLGILGIPFLDVVRVLAAVLLLGNVQFTDGKGLEVEVKGEAELNAVAGLLGV